MAVISVEVPDNIAKKFSHKTVTLDSLYDYYEDTQKWSWVKVGEKASVVLDYLKEID